MPYFTNISQMKVCWPTNRTNIIIKTEELIKYYSQIPHLWRLLYYTITYINGQTTQILLCLWRSKTINSALESLLFNLFLIIHTLISEMQLFHLGNDAKDYYTRDIELSVISIYMIDNTIILQNSSQR